jgi:Mrp family chromosome partitioning ATPase
MSEAKPFSLAVVKGASRGAVLRTVRKRISVGSADDNDLVLDDPDVAPRHFLVLIEAGTWRIHTLSAGDQVMVDRRWTHPESGKRGALIHASGAEILLYPGDLDQRIVDQEVKKRATGSISLTDASGQGLITNVDNKGQSFPADDSGANDPTMGVELPSATSDDLQYANAPTVAAGRPPEDLREAARARLQGERAPTSDRNARRIDDDALANKPVRGPKTPKDWEEKTVGLSWDAPKPKPMGKTSAWDKGKKAETVPEVLAEPESQMMRMPGATQSMMGAAPSLERSEAEVIELKPGSSRSGNAWGDRPEPKNAWGEAKGSEPRNAWGDPKGNALVKRETERSPERSPERNAWGDSASSKKAPLADRPRAAWEQPSRQSGREEALSRPREPAATSGGIRVGIDKLMGRGDDPVFRILREPDGHYATSTRLLSTKVDELMRNLGYRMYMVTSAEPLSGKTTTACNLAFALAEDTHRRVALIEANFRYPRFADTFGLDPRLGILPVIEGRAQVTESVVRLSDRNLVILPAGGSHAHPGEVLSSPRFKQLISELANTVDVAILDAPSVMPSADVNLLLPMVDSVMFVVSDKVTKAGWISRAVDQVGEKRVLGAVYNTVPPDLRPELLLEIKSRLKQK